MTAAFREARVGGCIEAELLDLPDGSRLLRSLETLGDHPERLSDVLDRHADEHPERCFIAQRRGPEGDWLRISYAQMRERARSVGQALLDAGLSPERPLAILSGNDLEHATLMMAAAWVGVPFVSVSTAYSLLSGDFARLRHILGLITPGMVYAADAASYGKAIAAVVPAGVSVVHADAFPALLARPPTGAVEHARQATSGDTVVKILFTSGSTKLPKGVITTNRMLCANQQMLRQCMAFLADEPPVLVDWLPWSHTFGSSHNLGIALYNGGSFYIDEGKPTPTGLAPTVRNLTEISPTVYFNVPKGLEELAKAMDGPSDEARALRDNFFRRLQAIMFAAAGLSQAVWDRLDAHGVAACGERVRVLTSLGMTECAPSCTFLVGTHARSGHVGLPCPGVETKLVPADGKTEIRFRGPHVMPGYWRDAAQSAAAFDEDGFYKTGDAVRFVDESNLAAGLMFDGRIAEDFKLSTGTFVSVGPLRARIILAGHPLVQDAVLTGLNRDELGAMIFPRLADCRALAGLPESAPADEVLRHPSVRAVFQQLVDQLHAEGSGSANRIARLHLLAEPPSADKGEITDKGSINQRAVLQQRAALVEAMYEGRDADLIRPTPHQETTPS